MGIDPSYPPFEVTDGAGTLAGYDVDMAREIARRLGASARFVAVDVGGIHDALIARKFDVIISSLPPTPELSKQITSSRPYFNAGQVLVVRDGNSGVEGIGDLDGRAVAIEAGSSADLEMRSLNKEFPNLAVRRFSTATGALEEVRTARVDGAVVDAISALEFIAKTGITSGGLKIVGGPLTVEPFVASTRKADAALSAEIDRIIANLDREGFLENLSRRWLEGTEE